MKLQSFNCPNCKAPLEPIKDARFMFCPYCGNKIVIDDIDYYREDSKTHREQIRADKEVRKVEAKHNAEVEKEREKRKAQESEDRSYIMMQLVDYGILIGLLILALIAARLGY